MGWVVEFETTELVLSQGGSGNKKTGSRIITEEEIKKVVQQLIKPSLNN